jgi:glycine cleavage system regulatory protein
MIVPMADRMYLTMAALGTDQPGLVRLVSAYIAARRGNIEDSRMVALGGMCGLMLLVSAEPACAQRLIAEIAELEREAELRVMIQGARETTSKGARGVGALWSVSASAVDREGLIVDIADAVRNAGGNIVELDTTTYQAMPAGEQMFELKMTVALRAAGEVGRMKDALAVLATEHRIAIDIKPAERSATKAAGLTLMP